MEGFNAYLPILISIAVFLAILLIGLGVYIFYQRLSSRRSLLQKVKERGPSESYSGFEFESESTAQQEDIGFISGTLEAVGKRVKKDHQLDHSESRLKFVRAGIRTVRAPAIFWGSKIVLMILLPMILILVKMFILTTLLSGLVFIACLILALIGYFFPDLWVFFMTEVRKEKILRAFPDALDLMVVCLEAGMGLDAAIRRVADEMEFSDPEISQELKAYNYEVMAGQERTTALRNLAKRVKTEDVDNLVVLLIQAEKFGTSVARTMRVFSDTFRTIRFRRAEEKAAKLTVKLIFPLILFIFPSLFVVLMGPAAIKIYQIFIVQGIGSR